MGVFAHTGLYLMDAYPVMRKWLAECRTSQFDDGKIANIAPKNNKSSFFSGLLAGSVGWGTHVSLFHMRCTGGMVMQGFYPKIMR